MDLLQNAKSVLEANDRGLWTVPAGDLYPHQWLWDSCFTAIGLRHLDVERAKIELTSLLRGQWSNGMIPNIIFTGHPKHRRELELWRSYLSPFSPDDVATSGITQPPMLAEAVVQVGQQMKITARRSFYAQMYPHLVAYHEWLYRDRNPHKEGLILLLHPYESGLDTSPYWISEMRRHSMPWWVGVVEKLRLDSLVNLVRTDTRHIPAEQRSSNIEAIAYWAALHRLRRRAYNSKELLGRSLFAVEDLAFNCILIRANECLASIAKNIKKDLPDWLQQSAQQTSSALEQLWDESEGQYFSRSFINHKLIEEPSITTLLPLYAGNITHERARRLVELLKKSKYFGTAWPVPSVPVRSTDFNPIKYWQGPTWVNMNWLIIEGLKRYGYEQEAETLKDRTLEMVARSGCAEYFNPQTGDPLGAHNFSWTAALTIDLLKQ